MPELTHIHSPSGKLSNFQKSKMTANLSYKKMAGNFYTFSWYSITANMAQRSQRGKRKDERSTEDGVAWNRMASSASGWSVVLLTAKCGCR